MAVSQSVMEAKARISVIGDVEPPRQVLNRILRACWNVASLENRSPTKRGYTFLD